MTRDGFARLLIAWQDVWTREPKFTDSQQETAFAMLAEVDDSVAMTALQNMARDGLAFRPNVSELLRKCMDLQDDTPGWGEAWAEIRRAVNAYPSFAAARWSHPIVAETVRLVGWDDIGNAPRGDTVSEAQARNVYLDLRDRKQDWRQRYEGIAAAGNEQTMPEYLRIPLEALAAKKIVEVPDFMRHLTEGDGR